MSEMYRANKKYPIQVTKWKKKLSDLDGVVVDFGKQMVACALFRREELDGYKYAIFREGLPNDPEDLEDQSAVQTKSELLKELITFDNNSPRHQCTREISLLVDDKVWKTYQSCEIHISDAIREVRGECERLRRLDGYEHYHAIHLKGKWRDESACSTPAQERE